jgi:molybdopterin-guanine dinucleotide biosynthesis protein A
METVAAFILAGGRSSRMGSDKAFLELGGIPLIARVVELARNVTSDVRIIGDESRYAAFAPVVADAFYGRGPLGGIHAALRASESKWNLILAVDLPFLDVHLLKYLMTEAIASGATVTVPAMGNYFQPLCAVYQKQFAINAECALAEGRNKIDALFREVSLRTISEEELKAKGFSTSMFRNVNTPDEWETAKREFEQRLRN